MIRIPCKKSSPADARPPDALLARDILEYTFKSCRGDSCFQIKPYPDWLPVVKDLFSGKINVDGFSCCETSQNKFVGALEKRDSSLSALMKINGVFARYVVVINTQGERMIMYNNDCTFLTTLWKSHTDQSDPNTIALFHLKFSQLDELLTKQQKKQSSNGGQVDGFIVLYLSFPRFGSVSNIYWMSKAYVRHATCYPCGKEKRVTLAESCATITSDDPISLNIDKNDKWLHYKDDNSNKCDQDRELQDYYANCCEELIDTHTIMQALPNGRFGFVCEADAQYDETERLRKERVVTKALLVKLKQQNRAQEERHKATVLALELQIKEVSEQRSTQESKHSKLLGNLKSVIEDLKDQLAKANSDLLIHEECVNKTREQFKRELAATRKSHQKKCDELNSERRQSLQKKESMLASANERAKMDSDNYKRLECESQVLMTELWASDNQSRSRSLPILSTAEQSTSTVVHNVAHACTQTIQGNSPQLSFDKQCTFESEPTLPHPLPLTSPPSLMVHTPMHSPPVQALHTEYWGCHASPVVSITETVQSLQDRVLVVLQTTVENNKTCVLVNESWVVPILNVQKSSNPWAQLCNISCAIRMECPRIHVNPDDLQCIGFLQHADDSCQYYVYTAHVQSLSLLARYASPASPPASPPPLRPPDFTIQTQSNTHLVPILEYYRRLQTWAQKSSNVRPFKHILSALDIIQSRDVSVKPTRNSHTKTWHHNTCADACNPSHPQWEQYHKLMVTMQTQHILMQQNMLSQYKIVLNGSKCGCIY